MESSYPMRHAFHVIMEGQPSRPLACWESYNRAPLISLSELRLQIKYSREKWQLDLQSHQFTCLVSNPQACVKTWGRGRSLSARRQGLKVDPKEQSLGQRKFSRAFKFNFIRPALCFLLSPSTPRAISLPPSCVFGLEEGRRANQSPLLKTQH